MQQAINLSKITTITFDGGAMPSKFNNEFGLLTKPFYVIPSHFVLPLSDPKNIAQTINQELQAIESLRYEYDESKHYWEIEFGTKPPELTTDNPKDYKLCRIIDNKKWAALYAAIRAKEKYPHLIDNAYDDELPPPPISLKWCRFVISLYYDEDEKEIIVEFNRRWGDADSFTFYQIFNHIKKVFVNLK